MTRSLEKQKRKLLFINFTIQVIMTLGFLFSCSLYFKNSMSEKYQMIQNELKNSFEVEEKRVVNLYSARIDSNLGSFGVMEAIKSYDREQLYTLTLPRY